MSYLETKLPRILAVILLLVSVLMFITLIDLTLVFARGGDITTRSWLFPMIILATGAVLMWLLTRRGLAMQLYLAAFALWLITTGYYYYILLPN